MPIEKKTDKLIKEIELFVRYSVPERDIEPAIGLVNRYRNNAFVTRLFRDYYTCLPEAREEAVIRIARLIHHQGVHLFVVSTVGFSYLYAVSGDQVLRLGEYRQELDEEVLYSLGYDSQEAFLKICPEVADLQEYEVEGGESEICPVCGVPEGDLHLLGCAVEICPWCEGQLCGCNCRFEQLDTDEIVDEEQVEEFVELVTEKGRIPYQKSQAPAFPGTSDGFDDITNDKRKAVS